MTTATPTFDQITEAVKTVIAEAGPDFVYDTGLLDDDGAAVCLYSADGGKTGSCLYGKALIEKLGVEYNPEWEQKSIGNVLLNVGLEGLSYEQEWALDSVQGSQDEGSPYSQVEKVLDNHLARLVG